ncbi:MAG: hypothetical protein GY847_39285 [Proteobacteria bacterium]|nr:hypothetical protein [Pseudomonadota bacterium]
MTSKIKENILKAVALINQKPEARKFALITAGFIVVFGSFFFIGFFYMYYGDIVAEESYQVFAARQAMNGHIPCRDFAYTQMPLLPYLSGIVMEITGYGLTPHRITNLIISGLCLFVIILIVREHLGSFEPGFGAAFAVAASLQWTSIQTKATSHAWASLFLVVALWAAIARWPFVRRGAIFAAASVLAVLSNLNVVPIIAALTVLLIFKTEGKKERLIVSGIVFGSLAIFLAPIFALMGEEIFYFNWVYPQESMITRYFIIMVAECWQISPAVILLMVTGLLGVPALIKNRHVSELLILAAGVIGIFVLILPNDANGYSVAPTIPILAVGGILQLWTRGNMAGNPFRHVVWIFPLISIFCAMPRVMKDEADAEIQEVAEIIQENASKGPILTPMPLVAAAADRDVLPGTEQGMFSVMSPNNQDLAYRFHLTTIPDLVAEIYEQTPAAIIRIKGIPNKNFGREVPSMRNQSKKNYKKFSKAVHLNYRRIHRAANMEVLVPN